MSKRKTQRNQKLDYVQKMRRRMRRMSLIRVQEGEKMKRVNEKFVAAFAEIHADIPASDPALRFDEERGRGG